MRYLILLVVSLFLVLNEPTARAADTPAGDHGTCSAQATPDVAPADLELGQALSALPITSPQLDVAGPGEPHLICPLAPPSASRQRSTSSQHYSSLAAGPGEPRLLLHGKPSPIASRCRATASQRGARPAGNLPGEAVPW